MNIDQLIDTANFGSGLAQAQAHLDIWNLAQKTNNIPCSIAPIYFARGQNKLAHNFTVPAFNLRGLTYQTAQQLFLTAQKLKVGIFVIELARSEMQYTDQPPAVYVSNILAAAIKTNWQQPIFIQCDHFQVKNNGSDQIKDGEIDKLRSIVTEAINAGMYNIDLDGSMLIKQADNLLEQQLENAKFVAHCATCIRELQPAGITISLGGEIGEIGSQHNSTIQDVQAFMDQFLNLFGQDYPGLSKLAVQTGTSHGGIVDEHGQIVKAQVAFENIKQMSEFSRDKYGMAGVVQHGASTLSKEEFAKFPYSQAIEIHLATGLQNLIFQHPAFPPELLKKMYSWLDENLAAEKKPHQTNQQFYYKMLKNIWKPFKKELWQLPTKNLQPILLSLGEEFEFFFQALGVVDSQKIIQQYIQPIKVKHQLEDYSASVQDEADGLVD